MKNLSTEQLLEQLNILNQRIEDKKVDYELEYLELSKSFNSPLSNFEESDEDSINYFRMYDRYQKLVQLDESLDEDLDEAIEFLMTHSIDNEGIYYEDEESKVYVQRKEQEFNENNESFFNYSIDNLVFDEKIKELEERIESELKALFKESKEIKKELITRDDIKEKDLISIIKDLYKDNFFDVINIEGISDTHKETILRETICLLDNTKMAQEYSLSQLSYAPIEKIEEIFRECNKDKDYYLQDTLEEDLITFREKYIEENGMINFLVFNEHSNPNVLYKLAEFLLEDEDTTYISLLLENSTLPSDALSLLISKDDFVINKKILEHPNCNEEVVKDMITKTTSYQTLIAIIENQTYSKDIVSHFYEKIFDDEVSKSKVPQIERILKHKNCLDDIFYSIYEDIDSLAKDESQKESIEKMLINDEKCPKFIIESLEKQQNTNIEI